MLNVLMLAGPHKKVKKVNLRNWSLAMLSRIGVSNLALINSLLLGKAILGSKAFKRGSDESNHVTRAKTQKPLFVVVVVVVVVA
jgi:hypothetical protein